MSDILTAFSGAKRSDSGSRTVFDKIYGLKGNLNPVFAGADRPEFHKTLDGFEQACVEKEVSNLISAGQAQQADETQTDWNVSRITTLNFDTVFGKNVARHQHSVIDSTIITRTSVLGLSGSTAGRVFNYSFMIRRNSGIESIKIRIEELGGASSTASHESDVIPIDSDFKLASFSATIAEDDRTGVRFSILAGEAGEADIVAGLHMPIESAYPVLFTEGTRLAPSPPITDSLAGLENGGTLSGVVDLVNTNSSDYIFESSSSNNTEERSRFIWQGGVPRFLVQVFGSSGGIILFTYPSQPINERFKFAFRITFNGSKIQIDILQNNVIRSSVTDNAINTTTDKNLRIGHDYTGSSHQSYRAEKIAKKDSIIRVGDSDAEKKQFFENITRGTSIQTAASEITIAP